MILDSLGKALEVLRSTELLVDDELCLNIRGRKQACDACAEACRAGALAPGLERLDLAEDACTGCGACVPACPAGVLRLVVFDPERFLASVAGQRALHLHCSASSDEGGGVVVPCHAVIDARLAAAAGAEGAHEIVLHGLDHCAGCDRGAAGAALERTRLLLERWFGDAAPVLRQARPGERPPGPRQHHDQRVSDRRGFLRLSGFKAAASAAWMVPAADQAAEDPLLADPAAPLTQRRRPVAYQQALAARVERLPWAADRPLPWQSRFVTDSCTTCMVCAERCPTAALSGTVRPDSRELWHEAGRCTGCGLCGNVCPEGAIRARAATAAATVAAPAALIMRRGYAPCRKCGQPYPMNSGGDEVCPPCRNEAAMDDEWIAMLGG